MSRTPLARVVAAALVLAACGSPLDPSAPAWVRIPSKGPAARWGHAAVYDAVRDRMIIFAGQTPTAEANDVWSLDLGTQQWSQLATGPGPSPRVNPAMVLDAARNRLVVYGGRTGSATLFDDAWGLDLESLSWTQLPNGPTGRQRAHVATDGTTAWFYGGEGFLSVFGDLWAFDLAMNTWTELPTPGNGPGARTCGAFALHDGGLFMIEGHNVVLPLNGTYRYDLGMQQWSQVTTSGGTAAGAHWGYAVDEACDQLYLSGGDHMDNYDTSLTDLFTFDDSAFKRLPVSTLPPVNDHATLIVDALRHDLILYGGTTGDGESCLGDAWVYALPGCQ